MDDIFRGGSDVYLAKLRCGVAGGIYTCMYLILNYVRWPAALK